VSEQSQDTRLEAEAATIHSPTLLLKGAQSPQMFLLTIAALSTCIPDEEQITIANTVHLLDSINPIVTGMRSVHS